MKSTIAFALAAGKLAAAHSTFQSFVMDGTDVGTAAVQVPSNGNNPILDVTSTAMICNGGTAMDDYVEVAAGSEVGMQWHHNTGAPTGTDADEPIASSHKGPVMVYLADADTEGKGESWVKIYEDGYDGSKWGVDNFITNKGIITVTIPSTLKPGNYWIRPELIGLHEANTEGKAQFYNGCGQIKVTGSGSTTISGGVDMTKAYSAEDPGVLCNIYSSPVACTASGDAGYDIPGPAVWDAASSGGSSSAAPASSATASSSAAAASSAVATSSAAAASSAAPTSSAAAATSAAPTSAAASSTATATEAAATPSSTSSTGSDSSLPETFTISEFIAWLETKTGSSEVAKRFARAFGRRAHARDFA